MEMAITVYEIRMQIKVTVVDINLKLVTKQNVCDGTTFRMDGNMMCRSCIDI